MADHLQLERRKFPRKQLSGLLPGRLYIKDHQGAISCRPVDVSPIGLGILTSENIPVGSLIILETKEKLIELAVTWVRPDFGKKSMYRYGLEVLHKDNDMELIFLEKGCLK